MKISEYTKIPEIGDSLDSETGRPIFFGSLLAMFSEFDDISIDKLLEIEDIFLIEKGDKRLQELEEGQKENFFGEKKKLSFYLQKVKEMKKRVESEFEREFREASKR